jgi:hypothetical protein
MMGTHALLQRARAGKRDRDDAPSSRTAGVVGQRTARPPTRAVVGGLLVAVAAVGAFVLATPADGPSAEYVIAAHALDPGARIEADDLTVAAVDLPPDLATLAFTDASALIGAVSLGPVAAGQLVQEGDVGRAPLSPFEVSLALEGDRALDGRLVPGELVAVLATYGSGADAETLTVASTALVERVSKPTGLAVGTADVVTLGLPVESDAQAVVHAARAGELTLVRTDSATAGASYQPAFALADTGGL